MESDKDDSLSLSGYKTQKPSAVDGNSWQSLAVGSEIFDLENFDC